MEEAAFLMAVQRVIGGVEIEDDLFGRAAMGLQKQIHQQRLDHRPVVADLVIAGRLGPAQLEPVQRRLARHRRAILSARFKLAGKNCHHRIMPELVVVDQVPIALRQSEDALADQRLDLVLDQVPAAPVAEAGGEAIDDPDRPIGRAEQQRPRIRGDASAVESRDHPPAFEGCKSKQIRDTLWLHRGAPRILLSCCDHNKFR